ncbi:protein N-terminal asparagine amidohydrolase [Platysternon megacephalum]|uniref:Protein N-terminal asparagine amidohydrolase n=1 Tax=Platysternon megacephalum TaxID=55544 RepID=A0A4D9EDW3_9SAUR|nr:protein N-terminal asparagine amidohydrolase [Platysternon megacephalum]
MVVFKKIKTFEIVFSEPDKVFCSGEKVAGRVLLEVTEATRVSSVKVLACGEAKVVWIKGPQQCKQEMEYLRYEDVLTLDDHPPGENLGSKVVLLCVPLWVSHSRSLLKLKAWGALT